MVMLRTFPVSLLVVQITLGIASGVIVVLGQTEVSNQTTMLGALVAGFTLMTGLMVWVIKRLLDTTLPGVEKMAREAQERTGIVFQQTIERIATNCTQESHETREAFAKELSEIRTAARADREQMINTINKSNELFIDRTMNKAKS